MEEFDGGVSGGASVTHGATKEAVNSCPCAFMYTKYVHCKDHILQLFLYFKVL